MMSAVSAAMRVAVTVTPVSVAVAIVTVSGSMRGMMPVMRVAGLHVWAEEKRGGDGCGGDE